MVTRAAFSPDGKLLASAGANIKGNDLFSPDGRLLTATGSGDQSVRLWADLWLVEQTLSVPGVRIGRRVQAPVCVDRLCEEETRRHTDHPDLRTAVWLSKRTDLCQIGGYFACLGCVVECQSVTVLMRRAGWHRDGGGWEGIRSRP